jgi:hypothetical protein
MQFLILLQQRAQILMTRQIQAEASDAAIHGHDDSVKL